MARSNLEGKAHAFADELQLLLNRTVADNARIVAIPRDATTVAVGTSLNRALETQALPLRTHAPEYRCYLEVLVNLRLEPVTGYLTTATSMYSISASPDANDPLFHYDYERDKKGYTEAHMQVFARNEHLDAMMRGLCVKRNKKSMNELHFPVGGRRFRPTLEDLIEFLVDEMLVDPRPEWKTELDRTRNRFRDIQLKAAVRRYPDLAAQALREIGWPVGDRPPEPKRKWWRSDSKLGERGVGAREW